MTPPAEDQCGPPEPPTTVWGFFVRGWRPFAGWCCGLVIAVHLVAIPLIQVFRHVPVTLAPIDWIPLTGFAGLLVVIRTIEKTKGEA